MSHTEEREIPPRKDTEKPVRKWAFLNFVKKGVRYSLIFSLVVLAAYTIGSMPDPGFSDRILFLLLRLLRYSSLLLCAMSLFALGIRVHYLVYYPSFRNVVVLFLYFLSGILGAGLAMLNSVIIAAVGGVG